MSDRVFNGLLWAFAISLVASSYATAWEKDQQLKPQVNCVKDSNDS